MKKISKENNFVFCPSSNWYNEVLSVKDADKHTQEQVLSMLRYNKLSVCGGWYLANRPNKKLMVAEIGAKFWDNGTREITNIEKVSKGIILVTHKEAADLPL